MGHVSTRVEGAKCFIVFADVSLKLYQLEQLEEDDESANFLCSS